MRVFPVNRRPPAPTRLNDQAMPLLYLLRHAKSSWDDPALSDHDRPLAPRGRQATELMAEHLRRERIAPSLVLCSSAQRARETLDAVAPAFGADVEVLVEPGLYGAPARELLDRVRALPGSVDSAMLIGHNPAIQDLALELAGSGEELEPLAFKYPTGALATLAFEADWRELGAGDAELRAFVRPKDLR
jgi:phosphohistidine phosphatase